MNDGGPAFPGLEYTPGQGNAKFDGVLPNGETAWSIHAPGMTLLDYMAGKVLEGLYAGGRWIDDPYQFAKFSVEEAYAVAGLAIKERARLYAAAKGATDAKA